MAHPDYPTPDHYDPNYPFTGVEYIIQNKDKNKNKSCRSCRDLYTFHGRELASELHAARIWLNKLLHYKAQSWRVFELWDHKYLLHSEIHILNTPYFRGEYQVFNSIPEIQALLYASATDKRGPLGRLRRKLFSGFPMRGLSKPPSV